jgi:hypothetical protein
MLLAFKRLFLVPDPPFDDDPRGPRAARPLRIEQLTVISRRMAVVQPIEASPLGGRRGHRLAQSASGAPQNQKETNLRRFQPRVRHACALAA